MIVFPFLGAGITNILPTFLISCAVHTRYSKALKYLEQYFRDYLSGIKVRISICSEYDAVFIFSCIASCNFTKLLLSLSYHKNQTINLASSQLALFMLLKYYSL